MTMHSSESSPFPSPFLHILKTNHVPDKGEIQKITTLLREPERKLDALNHQILRLEETLMALRTQRDSLQTHIDHHRALLSPFRRFPGDLLREIFVQCLDPVPIRSTKHAPLLFTTICRSWCQIALTTPRLWCSINIFIPVPGYPLLPDDTVAEQKHFEEYRNLVLERLAGAKCWLSRSGSVPITLFLSVARYGTRTPQLEELLRSVLEAFILFRSRWKEVQISNASPGSFVALKLLESSEFPQLESLDLTLEPSLPDLDDFCSLLHAPSLSKLHISVPASEIQLGMARAPAPLFRWRQISEISILLPYPALEVLKTIMSVSQTVRKCTFIVLLPENIPDHYAEELDCPYIHLALLEWLDLQFMKSLVGGLLNIDEHTGIKAFMDVLNCPLLEDLIMEGSLRSWNRQDTRRMGSPLTQFLEQSGCSLKFFKTNLPLSPGGFEECLQFMPTITSLSLHSPNWNDLLPDDYIHPLIPVNGPEFLFILCPLLQALELANLSARSADALTRLIAARLMLNDDGDTRRIKTVWFTFREYVEEEHCFRVNEFREQGLDIQWEFPPGGWKDLRDPRDGEEHTYSLVSRPMLSF